MGRGLSIYARKYLTDLDALRASLVNPVLLWEAPREASADKAAAWMGTESGSPMERPRHGEPLVFELKKSNDKKNAFPMGITLGRVDSNDVGIGDPSVSRFHAYFQQDAKTKVWVVVDAESKNGTFLGGNRLKPGQKEALADGKRVQFGDVLMQFFLADGFLVRLKRELTTQGSNR